MINTERFRRDQLTGHNLRLLQHMAAIKKMLSLSGGQEITFCTWVRLPLHHGAGGQRLPPGCLIEFQGR